ncbi:MAG TPA: GntR family transcriptional regulator [Steroidobacteraceae bacterium]|nr:GntR family transcriptional regulator [Steroidobacteraceae bacterium]
MSDTVLKRTCMRDRIRDVLVARILDGSYPAGTQLKELVLAREFNVSQAPIREALRELEGSGLVHSERYRGTLVRGTDFHEILDSYELRATLETRALHLALPYGEALIAELQRCHGQMRAALQAEDPERYIDYAMRFHRRLMEGSGNRAFLNVWDSLLWDVRGRIVLQRFVETGRSFAPLLQMHEVLLARLAAQDCAGACEALRAILDRVCSAFGPA